MDDILSVLQIGYEVRMHGLMPVFTDFLDLSSGRYKEP